MRLRPSLRAATSLERLQGGFEALFRKIEQFDTRTIKAVIRAAATDQFEAERYLASTENTPLRNLVAEQRAAAFGVCAALIPQPKEGTKQAPPSGKPMPWSELYARLYQIATGWLNWAPETAWNATPDEIAHAYDGLIERLKAEHGTGDEATQKPNPEQEARNEAEGLDPEFDRDGLRRLKASIAGGV